MTTATLTSISQHDPCEAPDNGRIRELFEVLADERGKTDAESIRRWRQARGELIEAHMSLVDRLAFRYRGRGESLEDLRQVAAVGMIKAVDGFSLDRGTAFASYAVPTIVGEIKRWFRDKTWAVRVPRRVKDIQIDIRRATATLTQLLGRSPTVCEVAEHLGVGLRAVTDGLEAAKAYSTESVWAGESEDRLTIVDVLGSEDPELISVEDRLILSPLMATLPERQRRIIGLRFFANMTQLQIASEIGVSQMHISRLLRRSLGKLREQAQSDADVW